MGGKGSATADIGAAGVVPTLYVIPGSPSAWRIWLALEHVALPHRIVKMSFNAGDTRTAAFRALNPRGQVPVLVDGTLVLYESIAIVEYLLEAYENRFARPLLPLTRNDRARCRRLALEAIQYVHGPIHQLIRQAFFRQGEAPDRGIVDTALATLESEFMRFGDGLQGAFACGDAPTWADFCWYPYAAFLRWIQHHEPNWPVSRSPAFIAWATAMQPLPAAQASWPGHWPPDLRV